MKRRRQCKCLLLALYSLLLLLLPCLLHSDWWQGRLAQQRQMKPPGARRCPSLEGTLALWHLDPAPRGEEKGPSPQPGKPMKQHIYLHATWRTGSSFLGELFNQHRDVFYMYEPAWHIWQVLYPGDAGSLQGALRDMLRSLFLCDFSVLRLYSLEGSNFSTDSIFGWSTNKVICSPPLCPDASRPRTQLGLLESSECRRLCPPRSLQELEAECRRYPAVVIKEVRLLEAGVLLPLLRDPELNLRVIQLFRDPRAVHNSRLKTKYALMKESVQVLRSHHKGEPMRHLLHPQPADGLRGAAGEGLGAGHGLSRAEAFLGRALDVICEAWLQDLLLFSAPVSPLPDGLRLRYMSLRYEDLVQEPGWQLARLLRFAGLSPLPELEAFALNLTRGPSYPADKPFLISARNARQALGAWRERLSRRQVRQVEEACHGAMEVLNYQRSSSDSNGKRGREEKGGNTYHLGERTKTVPSGGTWAGHPPADSNQENKKRRPF